MPYDPDAAAALLDEAGWAVGGDGVREKDGQRLEVRVMTPARWPGEIEALQAIQSQWRDSGIDMKIEQIESGAMTAMLNEEAAKNVDDPSYVPTYQGCKSGLGTAPVRSATSSSDPSVTRAAEAGSASAIPPTTTRSRCHSRRHRLRSVWRAMRSMAQILMDNQLRLPIYVIQSNIAASSDVQGFVPNPNDSLSLRGVSIEG